MSIRVLSWVLNYSEVAGADRHVLIALADYAHDDGAGAYPSIPKIAHKAKVGERTAERSLKALEAAGHITEMGKTPRGTRSWRVNMTPANLAGETANDAIANGADGGSLSIGEPSLEPLPKKKQRRSSGKAGDRFKPDPDSEEDRVIDEIFTAWHTGAGQNGNSYLTIARAGQVRARIKEIVAAEPENTLLDARNELLDAVKGLLTSKWHVEQGEIGFPLIFRNRERVTFCLERLAKTAAETPDAAERFSKYDRVIENGGS